MRNKKLLIIFGILLSLTLLIAIGSAVFSIRMVTAYCYNTEVEQELTDNILADRDKLIGKSIFFLKEDELIKGIEERVGGIKVINIERLFPNRVSINYVRLYDYFEVYYDGYYYVCDIEGRVLDKRETGGNSKVISVKLNLDEEPQEGKYLQAANKAELEKVIYMLERLDYSKTDATSIIKCIDFVYDDYSTYVQTRTGAVFRLLKSKDGNTDTGALLRKALSAFVQHPEWQTKGIITVNDNRKNDIVYNSNNEEYV